MESRMPGVDGERRRTETWNGRLVAAMGEQLGGNALESLKEYSFSLGAAHNAGQLTAVYMAACTPGKHSSFSSLSFIVSSLLNLYRAMISIIGQRSVVLQ